MAGVAGARAPPPPQERGLPPEPSASRGELVARLRDVVLLEALPAAELRAECARRSVAVPSLPIAMPEDPPQRGAGGPGPSAAQGPRGGVSLSQFSAPGIGPGDGRPWAVLFREERPNLVMGRSG